MNELYQLITNAWVAECIHEFGRPLDMNIVTETGCGHAVADDAESLVLRNGQAARMFTIIYDHRSKMYATETAIN